MGGSRRPTGVGSWTLAGQVLDLRAQPESSEQLTSWFSVLDEAEAILEGKKLVPHWRFAKGIDMKAFFEQPQTFDLVLLLTGQGAFPYLADGDVITAEEWNEVTRGFEGSFFEYAMWFN